MCFDAEKNLGFSFPTSGFTGSFRLKISSRCCLALSTTAVMSMQAMADTGFENADTGGTS